MAQLLLGAVEGLRVGGWCSRCGFERWEEGWGAEEETFSSWKEQESCWAP